MKQQPPPRRPRSLLPLLLHLFGASSAHAFGVLKSVDGLPTQQELKECVDTRPDDCPKWARDGECDSNPGFMLEGCRASCHVCQSVHCHDKESSCKQWADEGECGRNGDFMLSTCAFSCAVCDVTFKPACKRDPSEPPAAVAGTIDDTFRRALELFPQYGPRVLNREPWIVSFDTFLSEHEADHLLKTAGHAFERSLAGDGVTPVRTSSTSWCNVDHCLADPLVQVCRDGSPPACEIAIESHEIALLSARARACVIATICRCHASATCSRARFARTDALLVSRLPGHPRPHRQRDTRALEECRAPAGLTLPARAIL